MSLNEIEIKDFETLKGSLKTEETVERKKNVKRNSLPTNKSVDHFSIYSEVSIVTTQRFNDLYKKVAIIIEAIIFVVLMIIILKNVSLFQVFNVVTTFCYPTICIIVPVIFFKKSIELKRRTTFLENLKMFMVVTIGIVILILSMINLFF